MESRKPLQNYHLELEFFDFVTKTVWAKSKATDFFSSSIYWKGVSYKKGYWKNLR